MGQFFCATPYLENMRLDSGNHLVWLIIGSFGKDRRERRESVRDSREVNYGTTG